ncbi:hypothetical protein F2P56_020034, partial [Juglans regia]
IRRSLHLSLPVFFSLFQCLLSKRWRSRTHAILSSKQNPGVRLGFLRSKTSLSQNNSSVIDLLSSLIPPPSSPPPSFFPIDCSFAKYGYDLSQKLRFPYFTIKIFSNPPFSYFSVEFIGFTITPVIRLRN